MAHEADLVRGVQPLGFQFPTSDPFLFCVHHHDAYPAGNAALGPAASLAGRDIGQDFAGRDGWRMYHGDVVPGFPQHPHRGFETVTIVRQGLIDHSDSLGSVARFGAGDVQWLTAGRGIVHAEMFPLVRRDAPNPAELFQIWLNLPRADKLAEPHFSMLWRHQIPKVGVGAGVELTIIAGPVVGLPAPAAPPPRSWAARPEAEVAIWLVRLLAGARHTLPAASAGVNRTVYVLTPGAVRISAGPAGGEVPGRHAAVLRPVEATVEAGAQGAVLLLLQGRPIGEPVAQHGPFVMNSRAELQQAFVDYQRTQFGGWPWPSDGPVHGAAAARFARRGAEVETPPE